MGDWLYGAWPRHASITTFSKKKKKSGVEFVAFVVGILCCLQEHRGTLSWYTKWSCKQRYKHIERICALVFLVNFPIFSQFWVAISPSLSPQGACSKHVSVYWWEDEMRSRRSSLSNAVHPRASIRHRNTTQQFIILWDRILQLRIFILRFNEASRYTEIYQERALACIWRCIVLW